MSLTIATCKHDITNVQGEQVCKTCGKVMGYDEVAGITDKDSHNIGMFGFSEFYVVAANLAKNLNLPQFAIHTIVKTASKLSKKGIPKKHALLFATVYACRVHDIPRLLEDIFVHMENTSGKRIRRSEKSILRLLNKISKNVNSDEFTISPPNKHYYLQGYSNPLLLSDMFYEDMQMTDNVNSVASDYNVSPKYVSTILKIRELHDDAKSVINKILENSKKKYRFILNHITSEHLASIAELDAVKQTEVIDWIFRDIMYGPTDETLVSIPSVYEVLEEIERIAEKKT